MNTKSQAALEFLITYGWAIIVVLSAIGALAYFGVLTPGTFLPNKCVATAGIRCVDKPQVNTNYIAQSITFNTGYSLTYTVTSTGTAGNIVPIICNQVTNINPATCLTTGTSVDPGKSYIIVVRPTTNFVKGQNVKQEITITGSNPNSGLLEKWTISLSGRY